MSWRVVKPDGYGKPTLIMNGTDIIAEMVKFENKFSNANIISAAPDLLKACQKVLSGGSGCAPSIEHMDKLKKECELAINKALQK